MTPSYDKLCRPPAAGVQLDYDDMRQASPITLSWVPRDVVNDVYNVSGTVIVGTFENLDEAKRAAREQYSVITEE